MRRALLALVLALVAAPAAQAEVFYLVVPQVNLPPRLVTVSTLGGAAQPVALVTGLAAGERISAIDVRPGTGGLYAVAQTSTQIRLVRIDQATGVATQAAPPIGQPSNPPGIGLDIDEATDDALVTTSGGQLLVIDLATGVATPSTINPSNTGVAAVVAYPNLSTAFRYAISAGTDTIALLGSNGELFNPFPLGQDFGTGIAADMGTDGIIWLYSGSALFRVGNAGGTESVLSTGVNSSAFALRMTGPVQWGSPAATHAEGAPPAGLQIVREGPVDGWARVDWSTQDGTAKAGEDYTAASGQLLFEPHQTTATVTVPLLADSADEPDETVLLKLESVEGVPVGADAQLVISDDDPTPAPVATPSPTPAPTTAPADTAAPVALVLPLELRASTRLRIPFAVSEAGRATVTLQVPKRGRLRAVRAQGTLATRLGSNTAVLRLGRAAARQLRGRRGTVRVQAADAAGNAVTVSGRVAFRR